MTRPARRLCARRRAAWATAAGMLALAGVTAPAAAAPAPAVQAAPRYDAQQMPGLGPVGTATMHGDAQSSDVTPLSGPGRGALARVAAPKGAACPTILAGSDGMVVALCTQILGRAPQALLLDPRTGATLASLPVTKGALLGGVYAYLDDRDRLVLVDGDADLLRIRHERTASGWALAVDERTSVRGFVTGDGTDPTDAVVGLAPGADGRVWMATRAGRVGALDPVTGVVRATALPAGERVDNSISASGAGVAVATSHAVYLLLPGADGAPRVAWRRVYDRGTARKPGQLSWGTGATPTFFGPARGDEYLTITDNADAQEHLLVVRSADGAPVCEVPVFAAGRSGTENSAMAAGTSVIVASTYGYPYPALPEGAGPSVPASAQFTTGGMERWEVGAGGCTRSWAVPLRSAAVPRWSLADGTIYTVERPPLGAVTGPTFAAVAVDAATGAVAARTTIALTPLNDTLQMVGTITPDGTWWQGTVTGVLRMSRR